MAIVANSRPSSIEELEERLSEPSDALVERFRGLNGNLLLLGVGGKMGTATARMAQRAVEAAGSAARVIGVSRFREPGATEALQKHGVSTIAGDLFDPEFVDSLPDAGC